MAQERRSAVLEGFLEGKHMCVVATGVLGRGLDLVNVTQVYNFDMPSSITDFIHQVKRALWGQALHLPSLVLDWTGWSSWGSRLGHHIHQC